MDTETLTNHIANLGKHHFENACKIILQDVFNKTVINVDGKNDGGTDFTSFSDEGIRKPVAYQITTQKSDIKNKAYKDSKKSIEKLRVKKFYFLTTVNLSEMDARKIEDQISEDMDIPSVCLGSRHIAGLLLSEGLLNKFLGEIDYPLPQGSKTQLEYHEMALHSYTLFSNDAAKLKSGIYDDTILFLLSEKTSIDETNLILETIRFLELGQDKKDELQKRIGALFGNNLIKKKSNGEIELSTSAKEDLDARWKERTK